MGRCVEREVCLQRILVLFGQILPRILKVLLHVFCLVLIGVFSLIVEQVICCGMTPLQQDMYKHLVDTKAADCLQRAEEGKASAGSLAFITQLKKLCNRKLVFILDTVSENFLFLFGLTMNKL